MSIQNVGFKWFVAVVESVSDKTMTGKVGIRLLNVHDDPASITAGDLLWAIPLMPVTGASSKGAGQTHGLDVNTHVVGFFMDGDEGQIPMVFGTWFGMGDMPSEAIGINSTRKVPIGLEKPITFAGKYGYNKVTKTKAGHMLELDDSPSGERVHLFHSKGTYIEMGPFGDRVDAVPTNFHLSVGGIRNDFTKLIHNTTTLGAMNQVAGGAWTAAAGLSASINAGLNASVTAGGAASISAVGLASVTGGVGLTLTAGVPGIPKTPLLMSGGTMVGFGKTSTTLAVGSATGSTKLSMVPETAIVQSSEEVQSLWQKTMIVHNASGATYQMLKAGNHNLTGTVYNSDMTTSHVFISPTLTATCGTSSLSLTSPTAALAGPTVTAAADSTLNLTSGGAINVVGILGNVLVRGMDINVASLSSLTMTGSAISTTSTGLLNLAGTTTSIDGTGFVNLGLLGAPATNMGGSVVNIGMAAGGSMTTTITISATGVVTIASAGGINLNGNVLVNGTLNTTGTLSQAGVQVKT